MKLYSEKEMEEIYGIMTNEFLREPVKAEFVEQLWAENKELKAQLAKQQQKEGQ